METLKVKNINRQYANWGSHCEQALAYTLTGEVRPHGHARFDVESDIPEYHMSVKSSGFTLASAKATNGNTFEEKLADFMNRVQSERFAYVSLDFTAYIMDKKTFERFVKTFCYLDRESTRNGGGTKIKCLKESKKMIAWLQGA